MSPITIGISIVATFGLAIGVIMSTQQALNSTKGSVAASQLQVVSSALHNYLLNNTAALINNTPIAVGSTNVVNNLSPTADELKGLSLINSSFITTPTYGDAFLTSITFPSTCSVSTKACPFSELVYYKKPFLSDTSSGTLDIHLLGNAVTESSDKNIGFSAINNPSLISGPGWQVNNPITTPSPGAIGVLGAYKFYSYNAALNNSYNWKSPVDSTLNLPTSSNATGDVRYVMNINSAFYWNGSTWLNLNSTTNNTVSLGASASNSGTNNTHIGVNAAQSSSNASQSNTAIGFNAGLNASGSGNTTVGASSGSNQANAINNNNTILGYSSANSLSSSNLTVIGSNVSVSPGVNNAIAIGNGINLSASNTAVIGSSSITNLVTSATYLTNSDQRLKSNIRNSIYGLNFINSLKPVDYDLKDNLRHQTGFIAQDVERIAPDFPGIIKPTKDNPYYALTYASFVPSLTQSIQELDEKLKLNHKSQLTDIKTLQFLLTGAVLLFLSMASITFWSHLHLRRKA